MRILLPASPDPIDAPDAAVDLHEHYSHNWVDDGGVRVNFISSIDGAAAAAGKSRGLQTPGDNAVFAALRDLADVILVGASTARTEQYGPPRPSAERRALRRQYGLAEVPAVAVVSGSLDLDLTSDLYRDGDPDSPTLIITSSAAPTARRNDIIDLAGTTAPLQLLQTPAADGGGVDFAAAVGQLRELGHRRILCEGGPRLFSAGLLAAAVDELCLTVSPMLVGPGGPRIVGGDEWPEDLLPQLRLTGLLLEDDALFCRYRVSH